MESQPSPGPRGGSRQAITVQHVETQGNTEEEATQQLRSPGRPHRGGDIINKMNGTGQAAIGRERGEDTPGLMQRQGNVYKVLALCLQPSEHFINVRHYHCG